MQKNSEKIKIFWFIVSECMLRQLYVTRIFRLDYHRK
jgi:hypothetical protein